MIYENYLSSYNGNFNSFHENLGIGCYPLHSLTSYLLCNLEFSKGRTIVQFLKEDVTKEIENQNDFDDKGKLKFIRPIQIIDSFESNFSGSGKPEYTDYEKALSVLKSSLKDADTSDEVIVLKAIALFNLSRKKIQKNK